MRPKEITTMENRSGIFGDCLVEGSAEEKKRGRRIKRRAIAVSVVLQVAALTALVIAPMLAKPAELKPRSDMMPIPPYNPPHPARVPNVPTIDHGRPPCVVCPTAPIVPITRSLGHTDTPVSDPLPEGITIRSSGPEVLPILDSRRQPERPAEPPKQKTRVHEGHIDAAMLVNRIEPVYPTIPRQLHRSGRVELHAIIATDGTIQSLQLVSGDPMFVDSAMAAVRQWRYKPTLLNGQPVEVDTFITVIYMVNQP